MIHLLSGQFVTDAVYSMNLLKNHTSEDSPVSLGRVFLGAAP